MWPWGHLGVAYLLYSAYARSRFDRAPRSGPAAAVAFGSLFPDLIDKPLAWWLGILPGGRTLAHSLLFAAVLIPLVYLLAWRLDRIEAATAFVVGHLSHLLADLPPELLLGYPRGAEFLLWPLLEQPTFRVSDTLFHPPRPLEVVVLPLTDGTTWLAVQFGLFAVATAVWYLDGLPGLEYVLPGSRSSNG